MVVIRHPNPGTAMFLSKHVDASIVNAGDGAHEHPTQALLDCFSIQEKLGNITGKKWLSLGTFTFSSCIIKYFCNEKTRAEVMVCGPLTLIPKHIESLGVTVETNLKKALQWADVANVLRVQFERMRTSFFPSNREYAMQYGITNQLVEQLDNDLLIMHPGPINRGVEISSDLADSEHAIILDQVENGVAIRMQFSSFSK